MTAKLLDDSCDVQPTEVASLNPTPRRGSALEMMTLSIDFAPQESLQVFRTPIRHLSPVRTAFIKVCK